MHPNEIIYLSFLGERQGKGHCAFKNKAQLRLFRLGNYSRAISYVNCN